MGRGDERQISGEQLMFKRRALPSSLSALQKTPDAPEIPQLFVAQFEQYMRGLQISEQERQSFALTDSEYPAPETVVLSGKTFEANHSAVLRCVADSWQWESISQQQRTQLQREIDDDLVDNGSPFYYKTVQLNKMIDQWAPDPDAQIDELVMKMLTINIYTRNLQSHYPFNPPSGVERKTQQIPHLPIALRSIDGLHWGHLQSAEGGTICCYRPPLWLTKTKDWQRLLRGLTK